MQSQCPQCHTAFRVSAEQLELAAGKVRCGQCRHVFVASEHFIDEPPTDNYTSISTDEITVPDIEMPTELFTDQLNPVEIDMPVLDALDAPAEEQMETEANGSELLAEVPTDNTPETPAETTTPETSSIVYAMPAWLKHSAANDADRETVPATKDLTEQDAPPSETIDANKTNATLEELTNQQQLVLTAEQTVDAPESPDPDEAIPLLVETYDASQLYPELETAPVIEQAQHTGLYSLAIIVLLAVFLLQGTYALRDTLAGQPALRPLMNDFCTAFDCALTLPREPEKILLTRSEVRSHPAQKGALLIKATIQNQARFRQAYPILRLQFSDLGGNPLLGRDFMPEEYLPDDVNIKAGMPINTDVNLLLELVDPGGQAVSFDFNLL